MIEMLVTVILFFALFFSLPEKSKNKASQGHRWVENPLPSTWEFPRELLSKARFFFDSTVRHFQVNVTISCV